jgi:hypothetical protein
MAAPFVVVFDGWALMPPTSDVHRMACCPTQSQTKKEELPVNFAHCVCKRRGSMSAMAIYQQSTVSMTGFGLESGADDHVLPRVAVVS